MPRRTTSLPRLPQLPTPPRPVGASKIVGVRVPRPRNTREALRVSTPACRLAGAAGGVGWRSDHLTTHKGWEAHRPR